MSSSKILFVCTGNTCRSPMAQAIAQQLISEQVTSKIAWTFDSAGVAAGDGFPASDQAVLALSERGIDLTGHQSKMITPELIDQAAIIFTMTPAHGQAILRLVPESKGKVFPLDASVPIGDPFGFQVEVYREVATQLEGLIQKRIEEIVR